MIGLRKGLWVAAMGLALLSTNAGAKAGAAHGYGVSVSRDLSYGRAPVGASQKTPKMRHLLFDVYRPIADGALMADRPAIIMAFGGAFHRGSKGDERFTEDGAQDSSMGDYCRRFARAGYVCFSIDYRLTTEDPGLVQPIDDKRLVPKALNVSASATARIELVRERMELPPLDDRTRDHYWHSILAAAEDMAMATAFVRNYAGEYGVDPDRIALGGFSAGAITALNTAYGIGAPVKAVFALSGAMSGYNLFETVEADMPPALFFVGQNDLDGIQSGTKLAMTALGNKGVSTEMAWVAGFGHFYPMGAVSLGDKVSRMPVEARILDFLEANLGDKRTNPSAR